VTTLAITGATGFVGGALVERALSAGHSVRALTRRSQRARDGVTWIEGALDRPDSLAALVEGADAVVHVAGVVSTPTKAGFVAGNIDGTRAMIAAAQAAGVRRFVHVSSLSAPEPDLSIYGWSKAEAETLVEASGLDWSIVRPSGVYGPGDMEMRDLFRAARMGLALLPPRGRVSLIAVDDLALLLLALATKTVAPAVYEVDDGHVLTHAAMAQAIARGGAEARVDAAFAQGGADAGCQAGSRGPPRRCEAHRRSCRLSRAPGLDRPPRDAPARRAVDAGDRTRAWPRRNGTMVSRPRAAIAPQHRRIWPPFG